MADTTWNEFSAIATVIRMKACRTCGQSKPIADFYAKRNDCKSCHNSKRQQSRFYDLATSMASNAMQRAKKKGIDFDITRQDILDMKEQQQNRCALSGWEMDWELASLGKRRCPPTRVSLDRIDSSGGYVIGNVQLVCDIVNRVKNNYSEEDFVRMCVAVAENS